MKHKPPTVADHNCTTPKTCVAKRCTNGCGLYEHKQPGELPEGCLWHDLAHGYVEGGWCGPGLIVQLRAAQMAVLQRKAPESEKATTNKPGSKDPGWDPDCSALLDDIDARGRHVNEETMRDWRRQARTILGFSVRSMELPNALCPACGQASLRVPADLAGDVYCSSSDCHDSDKYGWCIWDVNGYLFELGYGPRECRPTDRSRAHGIRWRPNSWAPIWLQMEREKAERELQEQLQTADLEQVAS